MQHWLRYDDLFCIVYQENEKSRDIIIEHRLHRIIIGTQGKSIREIRELFPSVNIFIPDQSRKSDIITLRGPKNDVDKCYAHLQKHVHELVSKNIQWFNPSTCLTFCLHCSFFSDLEQPLNVD